MKNAYFSHARAATVAATMALSIAGCVEEAAIQQPEARVPSLATRTIAPQYASFSNPVVTTDRTPKEYYLDLERCRNETMSAMGNARSDDVAALRRALETQSTGAEVVVRYDGADRAVVRDRAVKACLVRKGYAVRLRRSVD